MLIYRLGIAQGKHLRHYGDGNDYDGNVAHYAIIKMNAG